MQPMMRGDARLAWLMVLPALLVLGTFHLAPVGWLAFISLFKWSLRPEGFVGLANYLELVRDPAFGQAALQTIYFVAGTVPAEMVLALLLATLLFGRLAARGIYRSVFFLPAMTSTVAAGVIWSWIFASSSGIANFALGLLHIPPQRWLLEPAGIAGIAARHFGLALPAWAQGPSEALLAVMVASIWTYVGIQMVLFLAGMSGIPPELADAARVDGAGGWQVFRWITLPLLRPTVVFVATVSTILALRTFSQVYVMTGPAAGGPLGSTTVASVFVFNTFYRYSRLGYAAAASVLLLLAVLALALSQRRRLASAA